MATSSSSALPVGFANPTLTRRNWRNWHCQVHSSRGISHSWSVALKHSRVDCSSLLEENATDFRLSASKDNALVSSASKLLPGILAGSLLRPDAACASGSEAYSEISSSFVESGFQFVYLGGLLVLLGGGSFFVIRQILKRRELELAAKELQERARTSQASPVEYYELGAIMLRKKLYPVARKYLEQAIKKWEDDEQDLAQVYNALGFCYVNDNKVDLAIASYEKAVTLSPGYVIAWNNLGQAYEKRKDWERALKSYEQSLQFDPMNKVALACRKVAQEKADTFKGIPTKL